MKRPDLSFGKDDANRFLPWIIGFLAFVTSLTLAGWLSLSAVINSAESRQSLAFSITLPAATENPTALSEKLLALTQSTKGVAGAKILASAELKNLVRPWLGNSDSLDVLPLPVIIEGEQTKSGAVDFSSLNSKVKAIASGAEMETQSGWIAGYANSIATLRAVSLLVAILFLVMMGCIVVFVAKTSVRLHGRAVEILHSIGALDGYIAAQFESNVGVLAFKGAALGTLVGAILYGLIAWSGNTVDSPLLPHLSINFTHALLYVMLPLVVVIIAIVATRFSVLEQLARRP